MTTRELLYTAEEFFAFVRRPENASRWFELHHGVLIEMPSPKLVHGWISTLFVQAVTRYLDQNPIGYVFGDSNDIVLAPDVVYKPDAFYIAKERLQRLPDYFHGAPDIAVEIISPSNTAAEIAEKVEDYLRYGVRMVILLYLEQKTARVCRSHGDGSINTRTLTAEDWLDSDDVLPSFRVQVKTLFPDVPADGDQ